MPGIQAIPDEGNARYFHVTVDGPEDVSCLSQAMSIVIAKTTIKVYRAL